MSFLEEVQDGITGKVTNVVRGPISDAVNIISDRLAGMPPPAGTISFPYVANGNKASVFYPNDLFSYTNKEEQYHTEWIEFGISRVENVVTSTTINKTTSSKAPQTSFIDEISANIDKFTTEKIEVKDTINATQVTQISTIALHMPNGGLVSSYTNNFGGEEMGILANMDEFSIESFKSAAAAKGQTASQAILDSITGSKLGTRRLKDSRVASNPHIEAIYNGMGLREFSFEWDFNPRNESELINALAIVRAFKLAAMPSQHESSQHLFRLPSQFTFKFRSSNDINMDHLYGSDGMWCTNVTTDYTPDQVWATFKSTGKPIHFKLSLSFIEDKTLSRTDVERGL